MTTERQQLRDYLLGQLPEDAANELDARLFADDDLLREFQEEQDALIEDFLGDRLIEKEAAFFRAQIARSQSLQEKVASLRVLLSALEAQSTRVSHPTPSRYPQFLLVISPALAIMLCFVLFLYVRESHKNVSLNSQLLTAPHVPTPITHPIGGSSIAVAFLSANVSRGPSAPPEISVPAKASVLELQVELHQGPRETDTWDAEVRRGSEVVWKSSHIPLRRIGKEEFLPLFLDAGDISPGRYVVQYAPASAHEASQSRPFLIIKKH
jgi:hypothetical protein